MRIVKSAYQLAVGDVLTKDVRGVPVSGRVLSVDGRMDIGTYVVVTEHGIGELNPFCAVTIEGRSLL